MTWQKITSGYWRAEGLEFDYWIEVEEGQYILQKKMRHAMNLRPWRLECPNLEAAQECAELCERSYSRQVG